MKTAWRILVFFGAGFAVLGIVSAVSLGKEWTDVVWRVSTLMWIGVAHSEWKRAERA